VRPAEHAATLRAAVLRAAVSSMTLAGVLAVVAVAPASAQGADAPPRRASHNPYAGNAAAIAEGADLFAAKACSACHGAAGGGGMCPSLVNDAWAYGSDDATLFDLIELGSAALRASGAVRTGQEKVVGDMPPFAGMVSDDEAWKLIAWVRAKYAGDPAKRNW
jgi:mono/diheme cytochrome c family protein